MLIAIVAWVSRQECSILFLLCHDIERKFAAYKMEIKLN